MSRSLPTSRFVDTNGVSGRCANRLLAEVARDVGTEANLERRVINTGHRTQSVISLGLRGTGNPPND